VHDRAAAGPVAVDDLARAKRNADRDGGYRATTAHARAFERASRPKPAKLATNARLRELVQDDLRRRYSPEQIAGRLRRQFPEEPEMWVSTETIYQSLCVQSRGALKRELTRYLRTGRALRKPGRQVGANIAWSASLRRPNEDASRTRVLSSSTIKPVPPRG
jgi:IS30 family transposase